MFRKICIILITILILLIIVGIGVYFFYPNDKKDNSEKKSDNTLEIEEINNSLFKKYYDKAMDKVSSMSIEEKIGQLFLVRYDTSLNSSYNMTPGGYILFARDFEKHTKDSIKKELDTLQKSSKYPLILGVDEEGGTVTRVSRYPAFRNEKFASPKYYYETGGYSLLEKMEKEKAELLKSIGLNLNLAPVVDISLNENDFIYNRSFGKNAEETSVFAKNMVHYANENGINSCLKHFPGYSNNRDTHTGIAVDERDYQEFVKRDFLPFQAGIDEGVPSIMVSHNIVKSIDEKYPSSLSEKVISKLRDELKFSGIIMTDDLAMDAVKAYVENKEAATLAINAGIDMIITSDYQGMYQEVLNSYREMKIDEDKINLAVSRVIAWKYYSNLF